MTSAVKARPFEPAPYHRRALLVPVVLVIVASAAAAAIGVAQPALLAFGAGWLVLAGVVFREPRLAVPVIVLLLPLEISKLFFPFLSTRQELGGGLPPTSIIDVGRLAIATAGVVWALNGRLPRSRAFAGSALTVPALLLLALYALSVLWARDVEAGRSETLRLAFLIGFCALIPVFVRDRQTLRWCLFALIASAAALAAVGVYQQATGVFFWNEGLGLYGERRINATFADPNHFARLLLLALVLGLALFFFIERRWRLLLAAALALCALTLVFTGSRGAWLIALPLVPLTVLFLPLGGRARFRVLAVAVLGVVAAVALGLAVSPYFRERVGTFRFGTEASGARPYLIEAGLHMFRDHPVWGVGVGGYQDSFLNDYYYYKDPKIKANVTLSHSSAVTVVSELGVLGAVVSVFLFYRWGRMGHRLWVNGGVETRALVLGLWGMSLVILLSSQTEGRLFDDPYLWLAFGLGAALAAIVEKESPAGAHLLPR